MVLSARRHVNKAFGYKRKLKTIYYESILTESLDFSFTAGMKYDYPNVVSRFATDSLSLQHIIGTIGCNRVE